MDVKEIKETHCINCEYLTKHEKYEWKYCKLLNPTRSDGAGTTRTTNFNCLQYKKKVKESRDE